jgi:Zn-finger nucleic acid-binding protein
MQCPTDGTTLVMSERSGIEIDYCPQCRGVWLDRGELDKIIDRAASEQGRTAPEQGQGAWANPPAQPPSAPAPRYAHSPDHSGGYQSGPSGQGYYRKRKRESWLSELFD